MQAVIEAGLIVQLVSLLQNAEFEIKKEAAWAIKNATSRGSDEQIKYLVGQDCIKPLCDLLVCPDSDSTIISVCLEGLVNILNVGKRENSNLYASKIRGSEEEFKKIENLLNHDNPEICSWAAKLLKNFSV
ncbi:importin subunit alpha-1-like [Trifolium medium]|uniref:Importin subunit alpha-1-like n=1 Tax=Trifolium medium TaxID=97028 RepID=A0A392MTX1_9FABA|nr:importin subunit alpha-1-like [Trifolium medium]